MIDDKTTCFFGRGDGPLVSVLIPSRGNPKGLKLAILSCMELADDPNRMEFIVKTDLDDLKTYESVFHMDKFVRIITTPRGRGYFDIHNWLNQMAATASGDWLFIFNDDAVMKTKGWDTILCCSISNNCWHICPQDVMLLWPKTINGDDGFFILKRKTYEIVGRVCGSPYGDAWIREVMELIHCSGKIPSIQIEHIRDENKEGRYPTSYEEGSYTIASVSAGLEKLSDASKLLAYIGSLDSLHPWTSDPPVHGWCRWRESPELDPYHAFVRGDGITVLVQHTELAFMENSKMGGLWQRR